MAKEIKVSHKADIDGEIESLDIAIAIFEILFWGGFRDRRSSRGVNYPINYFKRIKW